MKKIDEEIKEIDNTLIPLRDQNEKLEKQIRKLFEKRQSLVEKKDKIELDTLPKDLSKLSKKQWEWILDAGHHVSSVKHNFRSKCLEQLGFSSFGFHPETNQTNISIHKYGFDPEKTKSGFNIFKNSLSLKDTFKVTQSQGFDIVQNPILIKEMVSCTLLESSFREQYQYTTTYTKSFWDENAKLI